MFLRCRGDSKTIHICRGCSERFVLKGVYLTSINNGYWYSRQASENKCWGGFHHLSVLSNSQGTKNFIRDREKLVNLIRQFSFYWWFCFSFVHSHKNNIPSMQILSNIYFTFVVNFPLYGKTNAVRKPRWTEPVLYQAVWRLKRFCSRYGGSNSCTDLISWKSLFQIFRYFHRYVISKQFANFHGQ